MDRQLLNNKYITTPTLPVGQAANTFLTLNENVHHTQSRELLG
jgi:hypothetical protein